LGLQSGDSLIYVSIESIPAESSFDRREHQRKAGFRVVMGRLNCGT
jgi:hypothetical protein